jgi:hypothetical protein
MMHVFLANNRDALIERCRAKVALRPAREATAQQLQNGVPLFLDQLIRTLRMEQTSQPLDSRKISGPSGGGPSPSEIGKSAAEHGRELLKLGFSVDQVVHAMVICARPLRTEVAPFVRTVFSIFKWNAGRSRCQFNRGQHREVSFIRGLVRQT